MYRIKNSLLCGGCSDNESDFVKGTHETLVLDNGEADLHKHITVCRKNPGHRDFIPLDNFSLELLPKAHQCHELFKLISAVASLTVRVDVRMVSPNRPQFWPYSEVTYPFYDMRGKTNLRFGSAKVRSVTKVVRTYNGESNLRCPCQRCQGSESPSDVWWEIEVISASHVVFDDIEASYTSLRLFYDNQHSQYLTLNKVNMDSSSLPNDWCRLVSVTCDSGLVNQLTASLELYFEQWKKVHEKYQRSRDKDKLTFVVSHPHGCPKQISIGKWTGKYKESMKKYLNKFTYNASTCPGSSGAPVHCVGYTGWWFCQQVHSGTLNTGLNYCGYGLVV
ncbi:hypothetical protein BgiBS90_020239 [Biomphalaria glabrata]|nr:hypothetical protein BgiBS90_020239 [Biomphalaria glabrata]